MYFETFQWADFLSFAVPKLWYICTVVDVIGYFNGWISCFLILFFLPFSSCKFLKPDLVKARVYYIPPPTWCSTLLTSFLAHRKLS